jgi:hypothetical protein
MLGIERDTAIRWFVVRDACCSIRWPSRCYWQQARVSESTKCCDVKSAEARPVVSGGFPRQRCQASTSTLGREGENSHFRPHRQETQFYRPIPPLGAQHGDFNEQNQQAG